MDLLGEEFRAARKVYRCDACLLLREYYGSAESIINELSLDGHEADVIRTAELFEWKINKGRKYIYQSSVDSGDFYTFRALPEIHEICIKYDMYDD